MEVISKTVEQINDYLFKDTCKKIKIRMNEKRVNESEMRMR